MTSDRTERAMQFWASLSAAKPPAPVEVPITPLVQSLRYLKETAQKISPALEAQLSQGIFSPQAAHYSNLLSQIDDMLELAGDRGELASCLCGVNLATIAQHFGEGFSDRFSFEASRQITLLIAEMTPVVSAYPIELVRLFDTLVRGFEKRHVNASIEITIRESEVPCADENRKTILFSFCGPDLGFSTERFDAGSYIVRCINTDENIQYSSKITIIK